MSVDNRRNLDFAFPQFAPGLPSVYERAGFDVRRPSRSGPASIKSSSKSQRAPGSSPALYTPQSLNNSKFESQPPLPGTTLRNNSSPRLEMVAPLPAKLEAGLPSPKIPPAQQIPPRAATRGPTLPLSTKKISVDSKASSSLHSAGSSLSQAFSGSDTTNTSTETGVTTMSPQMDFFFKDIDNIMKGTDTNTNSDLYNMHCPSSKTEHIAAESHDSTELASKSAGEQPIEHEFLAAPTFNSDRFSTTSSIYSSADPRRSELLPASYGNTLFEPKTVVAPPCPYPETTPEPTASAGCIPSMPPIAPNHARRVSSIKKGKPDSNSSSLRSSRAQTVGINICRECSLEISGKSVYSKDGKMTGHWHRSCFVCTDCRTSLSSEVYVLSDSPFCSDCYHQSNRSVCKTCGEGIEGLCLEGVGEDEDDVLRYHPSCLECIQCSLQLSDVYYELGGLTYCEDHMANAGQARRRTTRILMSS